LTEAIKRDNKTNPIIAKEDTIANRSHTLHDPIQGRRHVQECGGTCLHKYFGNYFVVYVVIICAEILVCGGTTMTHNKCDHISYILK
jgi:hypothetical protein